MSREMKDSGIIWAGYIPKRWKTTSLRYITSERAGGSWGSDPIEDENDRICIRIADFDYAHLTIREDRELTRRNYTTKEISRLTLKRNDLLVEKSGGGDKTPVGRVILWDKPYSALYANFIERLRLNETMVFPNYIQYALYTFYAQGFSRFYFNQTTGLQNLDVTKWMRETKIPLPLLSEQQLIANFLDAKCAEIDALSTDIQKQIEKLEEYKKAIITEAVTKGLDPNVEMKDSGIEWIGKTPIGWTVSKLGNVLRLRNEKNTKPLEAVNLISLYTDKGVVQHSDLEKTSGNKAQKAEGYKIVHRNDIVVNIILAWMGAMGISNYDGVTSPAYDVYEIDLNKIVPHYCHYILRTPALAGECYKYGRGIMMMRWRTYSDEFKKIKMPLPSIEEQQKIADFLDLKCSQINEVIDKKNQQLSTLEEYKKSIIYEYVTGKKEVPVIE